MPFLVRDNIFIGDINNAADVLQKGSKEFTHMLSLLSSSSISFFSDWRSDVSILTKDVQKVYSDGSKISTTPDNDRCDAMAPKKALSPEKLLYSLELAGPELKLVRMAVPLRDMEEEDLLDHLDVCLDFIEKGRKEGAILVHCFAGISRSAAVITAYLMRTEQKSQEDALESLRQSCDSVCPNDGFLEQLKMFEKMSFKVDHGNSIYKRFRLKILGDSYYMGSKVDSSIFGADPGVPVVPNSGVAAHKKNEKTLAYRCKKCRRVVAVQGNVVGHNPGEGEKCFEWRKRKSGNPYKQSDEDCTSLFIEPLKWMTAVEEGALEGKLSCVHCNARLGYFNWSGVQCSCGNWITPAFQIHKSRIDVSSM